MTEPPAVRDPRATRPYAFDLLSSWSKKTPDPAHWLGRALDRLSDLMRAFEGSPGVSDYDRWIDQVERELQTELQATGVEIGDGPILLQEVRDTLRHYIALETDWAYDIAALWVMMASCIHAISVVFYIIFSESKGKGKTTALLLLSKLTGGLNASDISPAALVHWLKGHPRGTVCIDEFDVPRDSDRDSALAAIVRTGYQADGSYVRWDAKGRKQDSCPTFGAKALGFRGKADDATEDRVFILPLRAAVPGRDGARLVVRNYQPRLGDLTARLRAWGERAATRLSDEDWESDAWLGKIEAVIGPEFVGANRETQLTDVCLRVCRIVGIDLTDSLRAAFGIRREIASANAPLDLEDAREVLATFEVNTLTKDAPFVIVRQKEFLDRLNARRVDAGLRRITDGAKIRNDLGIRPTWLTHPRNKCTWNIPVKEWATLVGRDVRTLGEANPTNLPNPSVTDEEVSRVSKVRLPLPAPEPEDSQRLPEPVRQAFRSMVGQQGYSVESAVAEIATRLCWSDLPTLRKLLIEVES